VVFNIDGRERIGSFTAVVTVSSFSFLVVCNIDGRICARDRIGSFTAVVAVSSFSFLVVFFVGNRTRERIGFTIVVIGFPTFGSING
jgi:hypothetical protein